LDFYSFRFGRTGNGNVPTTLQWIKVKTITIDECRKQMTKQNVDRIFDTNVCALPMDTTEGGGNFHSDFTTKKKKKLVQ
jgi:hypothetical protein